MATLTYRDAVGKALQDSLHEEPRLILIGQNIAGYTLKQMAEEFGESRIRDTSISESAMVGMAVGAAMKGWKAVVMIAYADIASVCQMAIVQSAAKLTISPTDDSVVQSSSGCRSRAFAATAHKEMKLRRRGFTTCPI
jgi:acetoin:2,6-dichlorophenolindophenol oxidoreductase subunit beta